MIVYGIAVPYINKGLTRSYNKHLEIFALERDDIIERYNQRHTYIYKKGTWVQALINKGIVFDYHLKVHSDLSTASSNDINGPSLIICDSLELAIIAKLLYIQNMQNTFENRINELRKKFNTNLPDIGNAVLDMKTKHPEVFI